MTYNKSSTKKRIKNANSKKSKIKNKLKLSGLQITLIAFIVVIVICCAGLLGIAKGIIDSAPDISKMDVIPTGFSTVILADDGETELSTLVGAGSNREYVTLSKIPDHLQQAFVAIEDSRFYEHNGIDLYGVARAGVATLQKLLTGDGRIQGASTITQQLIKNNVLVNWTNEKTFLEQVQRKLQEQYLAIKLEEQINDKDWILENYLNTINLGSNTLGVQSAANRYFGKDVSELTLSESAVIAGITQNPYGYDPIRFPEKNAERRVRVLDAMKNQGYINSEQYDEALADPVYDRITAHSADTTTSYNSYFVDALIDNVLNDLINKMGYTEADAYKALYHGGLTIVSTQNKEMQTICDEEANNLKNYANKPKYSFHLSFSVKKADGTTKNHTQYTMLSYYRNLYADSETEYNIIFPTEDACYDAIRNYQKAILKEGDTIVEGSESIILTLQPQVAMTVIDQSTGEVKAMVGGRGDKVGNRTWNRAINTKRQPGSCFKILTAYAAALDTGVKTLASVQDDAPLTIGDKEYNNVNDNFYGLSTMREAILRSYNITAIKTAMDVGLNLCYDYAQKFGISTLCNADKNAGLPLGGLTNGVTNLELTAAYATIANQGEYIEPSFYTAIYDHNGDLILDNTSQERRIVISQETAFLLTDAMRDVVTSGSGTIAYFGSTMDQAGKTGTSTANRDVLFAGYTPYYTCTVWGGNDDNSIQTDEYHYVKSIWREAMKRIHTDLEYKEFPMPSSITTEEVCKDSGFLPLDGTCDHCQKGNAIYEEYFTIGTIPMDTCNHHVALDICSETGMLAGANCPESCITKKVFIIGADPETDDKKYIATEEFLSTTCTHQAEDNTPSEDENSPEDDSLVE